jgi:DNA gyrase subunit B
MAKKPSQIYDASKISVQKGLDPVKKNPAMWIGDTSDKGLHHIVWEVVDNAVDEHLGGYCKNITLTIRVDGGLSVEDDGRGIPVDMHPTEKKSALELVLTTLHAGGKTVDRPDKSYQISGGLHGVGVSCTNALSAKMIAEVRRDGFLWTQEYERGIPKTPVTKGKKARGSGTKITFYPDPQIFHRTTFKVEMIIKRMREISYLNPGLKIEVIDEAEGTKTLFHNPKGIVQMVEDIVDEKDSSAFPAKPIFFESTIEVAKTATDVKGKDVEVKEQFEVAVAMQYTQLEGDSVLGFANIINTSEGGTHITGFRLGLTRVINQFARDQGLLKDKESNLLGPDISDGLIAVISVKLPHPQFEGQTKTKLGNPEVVSAVSQMISDSLQKYLELHPAVGKSIVEHAMIAKKARDDAKATANAVRRKSVFGQDRLPGKLENCSSKNPAERELILCEGISAAGTIVSARDARTQAVYPLRGKVINVERGSLKSVMDNAEIKDLIACLGIGITRISGEEQDEELFSLKNLRYHKVIIMTDADVDGGHIRTLLLTFFFRFMRPLIEAGHLYIAHPPLYMVKDGKSKKFAMDDEELQALLAKNPKASVTRFKGLGEMNADELGVTTVNPEHRSISRVTIESAAEAELTFSMLMGNEAKSRKTFLAKRSKQFFANTLGVTEV